MEKNEHKEHHREQNIHETRAKLHEVLFKFADTVKIVNESDLRENAGEHGETGLKTADNKIGDEAVAWTDALTHEPHITIRQAA